MPQFVVVSFYSFTDFPDHEQKSCELRELCAASGVRGTVIAAHEGINATLAGPAEGIEKVVSWLKADPRFAELKCKYSHADFLPFKRLKVHAKDEIVGLKVEGIDPNRRTGEYVRPEDWNALLADPDVVLIDVRNRYEISVGTFKGAADPGTRSFRQFPEFVKTHLDPEKHRKVATFCTGGIRCEKAAAFLLEQGFQNVYQLEGGILNYLETVRPGESLWDGECFVFDDRITLDHQLQKGTRVPDESNQDSEM